VVQGPLHQLVEEYKGLVKLVYIHTPLSPRSARAAELAECAYRQGKFWPYKDRLFEMQLEWVRAENWYELLLGYAEEVGIDRRVLLECLETGLARRAVMADMRATDEQDIKYTPTIIMDNGSRFVGSDIAPLRNAVQGAVRLLKK
jgi:protein-disulfide isomerase